ncbi:MAG: CapA family protein [Burkholderiales bacterium]|nr:CapA family protein [Burkholderiales bacterium]
MKHSLVLLGDINLMNVTDAAVPFRRVRAALAEADCRFANLECCLYEQKTRHELRDEGFFAAPALGEALKLAGIDAIGNANNVNYGAEAIMASCAALRSLDIPSTGAGANRALAYAPVVVERKGIRYGFLQRSSVYWPTNHEAGESSPGIAVLQGHTAYQPMLYKIRPELPPANRPGVPPAIITWADPTHLARYRDDVAALRAQCDILTVSHHWGLFEEVLDYQVEIAHAGIDAGADAVIGHGPHFSLAMEMYRDRPVFYGLGNFSFHTGHGGRKHGNWIGEAARLTYDGTALQRVAFRLVRHDDRNETYFSHPGEETQALARLQSLCDRFGTRLEHDGEEIVIWRRG